MKLVMRSLCGFALVAPFGLLACATDKTTPIAEGETGGATGSGGAAGSGGVSATDGGRMGGDGGVTTSDAGAKVVNDLCTSDPTKVTATMPPCNTWKMVQIPGTVCGDGSPYKFFVSYSNTSNNLTVNFEPGGACWDYDSCTGRGGTRGAANPHGITDDHMSSYQYLNLLNRADSNPVKDYSMVFVSYCTGDIHTGNNEIEYSPTENASPDAGSTSADAGDSGAERAPDADTSDGGEKPVLFHHAGHANTMAVIGWLSKTFKTVPKMLVTGCSAGGAGALLNYDFVRKGMGAAVDRSYLLDDSGPIFHSTGRSGPLDAKVRSSWNVDPIIDLVASDLGVTSDSIKQDFGTINTALADKYSKDRLALTAFRMDLNYSLYSYQRFYPNPSEADIHDWWWEDLQNLMATYDSRKNLSYFLPYFRSDNCSHCVSIPPIGNAPVEPTDTTKVLTMQWLGSEIQADKIDLHQYVETLLDDSQEMKSYVEDVQPNESFTPAVSNLCMQGG